MSDPQEERNIGSLFRQLFCGCISSEEEIVREIDMCHSLLSEVPPEVYMNERTLETLRLDCNHIIELPRQLFNCDELRLLSLSDNELCFIPPAISFLVNLQKLDISKNAIASLPDSIRQCLNLVYLDVSVNPLEKLPEGLVNVVSLQELYLTDVYLEFLPANFGKLVNLRRLELRDNSLSTLPKTMNRLVHLTRLDIGFNEFQELPEVINELQNLTELWIDGNHIRKLYPSIGHLRRLIHFDASFNKLENLPRDIGYWTRVQDFNVANNELQSLPTTIGNMKNLISLRLEENCIHDLPDSIGKLTNLEELVLSHNVLLNLPSSVGLLRNLKALNVDLNFLKEIPHDLGSCTTLALLSLRGNRLITMPAEIGHLHNLRVLNLVDNLIKFLPISILKLDNLSALWLTRNQSQPLVPMQQEYDCLTNSNVLTCFLLPQQREQAEPQPGTSSTPDNPPAVNPRARHICFASDITNPVEQPGRLSRAPTPYPKELRALAKHAKQVQKNLSGSQQRPQQSAKTLHHASKPLEVREATIATASVAVQTSIESTPRTVIIEEVEAVIETAETPSIDLPGTPLPVAYKSSPVIREARNIRTDSQSIPIPIIHSPTAQLINVASAHSKETKFPPPYHIAAAYSMQAQFFNPTASHDSASRSLADSPALSITRLETTSPVLSTGGRTRDQSVSPALSRSGRSLRRVSPESSVHKVSRSSFPYPVSRPTSFRNRSRVSPSLSSDEDNERVTPRLTQYTGTIATQTTPFDENESITDTSLAVIRGHSHHITTLSSDRALDKVDFGLDVVNMPSFQHFPGEQRSSQNLMVTGNVSLHAVRTALSEAMISVAAADSSLPFEQQQSKEILALLPSEIKDMKSSESLFVHSGTPKSPYKTLPSLQNSGTLRGCSTGVDLEEISSYSTRGSQTDEYVSSIATETPDSSSQLTSSTAITSYETSEITSRSEPSSRLNFKLLTPPLPPGLTSQSMPTILEYCVSGSQTESQASPYPIALSVECDMGSTGPSNPSSDLSSAEFSVRSPMQQVLTVVTMDDGSQEVIALYPTTYPLPESQRTSSTVCSGLPGSRRSSSGQTIKPEHYLLPVSQRTLSETNSQRTISSGNHGDFELLESPDARKAIQPEQYFHPESRSENHSERKISSDNHEDFELLGSPNVIQAIHPEQYLLPESRRTTNGTHSNRTTSSNNHEDFELFEIPSVKQAIHPEHYLLPESHRTTSGTHSNRTTSSDHHEGFELSESPGVKNSSQLLRPEDYLLLLSHRTSSANSLHTEDFALPESSRTANYYSPATQKSGSSGGHSVQPQSLRPEDYLLPLSHRTSSTHSLQPEDFSLPESSRTAHYYSSASHRSSSSSHSVQPQLLCPEDHLLPLSHRTSSTHSLQPEDFSLPESSRTAHYSLPASHRSSSSGHSVQPTDFSLPASSRTSYSSLHSANVPLLARSFQSSTQIQSPQAPAIPTPYFSVRPPSPHSTIYQGIAPDITNSAAATHSTQTYMTQSPYRTPPTPSVPVSLVSSTYNRYSGQSSEELNQAPSLDNSGTETRQYNYNEMENNNSDLNIVNNNYNQEENTPRFFVQDIPVPGQNIVAPTPKRPNAGDKSSRIPYLTSPTTSRAPGFPPISYQFTNIVSSPRSCRRDLLAREVKSDTSIISGGPGIKTKIPGPHSNSMPTSPETNLTKKWVFGLHKNATVINIMIEKNPDLGFSIVEIPDKGIFVDDVQTQNYLSVGDKILEVEGIDVTQLNRDGVMEILLSAGKSISMMISHI